MTRMSSARWAQTKPINTCVMEEKHNLRQGTGKHFKGAPTLNKPLVVNQREIKQRELSSQLVQPLKPPLSSSIWQTAVMQFRQWSLIQVRLVTPICLQALLKMFYSFSPGGGLFHLVVLQKTDLQFLHFLYMLQMNSCAKGSANTRWCVELIRYCRCCKSDWPDFLSSTSSSVYWRALFQ